MLVLLGKLQSRCRGSSHTPKATEKAAINGKVAEHLAELDYYVMKRKLTAVEKKVRAERRKNYEWIFMSGKKVRVKRPEMIEGMLVDEFIAENADDIWLIQHEMYDVLYAREMKRDGIDCGLPNESEVADSHDCDESEIPF